MSLLPEMLPKAVCLGGDTPLIWLQEGADLVTMAAYFFLPFVLVRAIRTRTSIRTDPLMVRIYIAWAIFIFCGGLERAVNATIMWWPYYYAQAITKWTTAGVSIAAVSIIAKNLIPGLIYREDRMATSEKKIQDLMDDMHDSLESLRDHNTRALEKVTTIDRYIEEPTVLSSVPTPLIFADLRKMLLALREELAKA